MNEGLGDVVHGFDADAFVAAVGVHAACGQVGGGQAHVAEARAVCAAADGFEVGIVAHGAQGGFGAV